jgi:hypothetical protein
MKWTQEFGTSPPKIVAEQINADRRLSIIACCVNINSEMVLSSQAAVRPDISEWESMFSSIAKTGERA